MSKRALITGITGQDGSYLAELLLQQGYEVFGVVRRLSAPNVWRIEHLLNRVTLIPADLLDQLSLIKAVEQADPHDAVVILVDRLHPARRDSAGIARPVHERHELLLSEIEDVEPRILGPHPQQSAAILVG